MYNISIYFCNTDIKTLAFIHLKRLKNMFATRAFSVISPYCLRMEACRRMEFIGVELTSGAELAVLVEKDTTNPVEKAAWVHPL
jgi:hypothetical protein